jgi:hypothetical protein
MKQLLKVFSIILTFCVIGYFTYSLISGWHKSGLEEAREQEQEIWKEKIEDLDDEIASLREELDLLKGVAIPTEKLEDIFGEELAEVLLAEAPMTSKQVENQILAFFSYLDKQEYVKALGLKSGTYQQFQQAQERLSVNTPIVIAETESLYRLLRNLAHFYKVMGKKRVDLVKGVLKNESDIIESVMKSFYLWLTIEYSAGEVDMKRPSFEVLYEYSAFLLNTLAGRSYLLRRDSRVRILTTYYCVLIIERANELELNSYGIDISRHITSLTDDIRNQIGFIYQEQYLQRLKDLMEKYYY